MSATDDEVEQLLRRTRATRERCNNRMALIGNNQISFKAFYDPQILHYKQGTGSHPGVGLVTTM